MNSNLTHSIRGFSKSCFVFILPMLLACNTLIGQTVTLSSTGVWALHNTTYAVVADTLNPLSSTAATGYRGVVRFDLSSIPCGATVTAATIKLVSNGGLSNATVGNNIYVMPPGTTPNVCPSSSTTLYNMMGCGNFAYSGAFTGGANGTVVNIALTNLADIQSLLTEGSQDIVFTLVKGITNVSQYRAKGALRPQLVLTYTTGAAPALPACPVVAGNMPANGATNVAPAAFTLSWTPAANTLYEVRFGTTNPPPIVTPSSPVCLNANANSASVCAAASSNLGTYTTPLVACSNTYYWSVTPKNCAGSNSACINSFSTISSLSGGILSSTNGTSFCSSGIPVMTTTGASGALQWESSPTGGTGGVWTPIAGANSPSYTPAAAITTTTYFRVVATCGGTVTSNQLAININPAPTATITPTGSLVVCNPSGTYPTLTSSTNLTSPTYQWKLNGTNIGGAVTANYVVPANANGIYTVVVTDPISLCSTTSAATTITGEPTPITPTVTGYSLCPGATTPLPVGQGMQATCGLLSATTTLPINIAANPTSTPLAGSPFTLSTTTLSLPASATITSIVINIPNIAIMNGSFQSEIRLALTGAITTAAAGGVGAGTTATPFNYTNTLNGPIVFTNNTALSLTYFESFDDGGAGVQDAGFPLGNSVGTITINYTLPATTQWYASAGATTPVYVGSTFDPTNPAQLTTPITSTTTFYAACKGPSCESTRVPATFYIGSPLTVSVAPSVTSLCSGAALTLTATGGGGGVPYSYAWTKNGSAIGTNSTVLTDNPTSSAPGTIVTYGVSIADACVPAGSATSTVNITVNGFTVSVTPNTVPTLCTPGTSSQLLTGSTTAATPSYQWTNSAVNVAGATTNTYTATAGGNFALKVTDASTSCTFSSAPVAINFEPTPAVPTVTPYSMCLGGSVPPGSGLLASCGTFSTSTTLNFNVTAQPVETNAAPGNVVASVYLSLPTGATITSYTINYNSIQTNGGSFQNDVNLGLAGAIVNAAAAGTGSGGSGLPAFNYTRTVTGAVTLVNNSNLDLLYWDFINDVAAGPDATFPTGPTAASITINYTLPTSNNWYKFPTGGSMIYNGSAFNPTDPTQYTPANGGPVGSAIPSNTTFYTTCGGPNCESARVPVVFSVGQTMTLSITPSVTSLCSGSPLTLTGTITGGGMPYASTVWEDVTTAPVVGLGLGVMSVTFNPTSTAPNTVKTYRFTATDACGNTSSVLINITVNGFVVNLNPNTAQTVCTPATTSLNLTGNTTAGSPTYQWLLGAGNIAGAITNSYSVTSGGNYSLKVTDAVNSCSVTSAPVTVTFEQTPADPTVTNYNACLNATVPVGQGMQASCGTVTSTLVLPLNIAANPATTPLLASPFTLSTASLSLPTGAIINSVIISVPGIQVLGGSYQSEVQLALTGAITTTAGAGAGAIGFGSSGVNPFNYTRTITGPVTYTNNSSLSLTYYEGFDDGGPTVVDATFPIGSNVGNITIDYTFPSTTNWYLTSTATTPIATGVSVLDPTTLPSPNTVSTAVAGSYTYYVACKGPNCESNRVPVTFNVAGPLVVAPTSTVPAVCSGGSVTLYANASGGGTPYSYAWKKNGVNFGGNSSFITDAPTATAAGTIITYSVTVTETCTGAVQNGSVNVTVNGFTASISPNTFAPVCGTVVPQTMTATTTAATPSYQWTINGSPIAGATNSTYAATISGNYSLTVTDASVSCSTSVTPAVVVAFEPIPATPTVTNINACLGGSTAPFSAVTTPSYDSTTVMFNVLTQPVETNAAPGLVFASAPLNLPAGVTVNSATISVPTITANGFSWMNDVRIGLAGAINLAAVPGTGSGTGPGTFNYTYTVTSPIVTNGTLDLLYWDAFNDVAAGPDATFTLGTNVASVKVKYTIPSNVNWYLTATSPTALWVGNTFDPTNALQNPAPNTVSTATSGTYTFYVSVKGINCESARVPVIFSVGQPLSVTVASTATTICAGSTINLTATALGGGSTYTYTWKQGGAAIVGAPNAASYPNVTPASSTNYSVSITDNCTPPNSATSPAVNITVNAVTATMTPSTAQQVCNPPTSSILLSVATSNAVTPTYQWVKNGADITGANANTYSATTSGNYAIKITDTSLTPTCSTTSAVTNISIFTTPSDPSPSNYAICQGGIVASGGGLLGSCTSTAETMSFSLPLLTQPVDVATAPGTLLGTINIPAFPAGSTITSATLAVNGTITPAAGSWQSDVRLGFTGSIIDANTQGTGTLNLTAPFTYTRPIPATAISVTGGAANLYYTDPFNDVAAGPDANFTLGNNVFVLTINYTLPATTYWYDSPTATTPVYIGTPFDPVSAGYVNNTVAGSTTYYSECHGTYCTSVNRAACVFTVNSIPTVAPTANTPYRSGCNSQMILTTSSTPSGTNQYVWYDNAAHAGAPKGTGTTIIANTGVPGTYTYYVFEVTTGGTPCYGPSSSVTFTTIGAIPTNLPITPNTNPVANTACIDNLGWTHFFFDDVTPTNADLMLLSAYESGHYLGALGTDINISNEVYAGYGSGAGLHICPGASAGCTGTTYPSSSNWYVMNRNWTLDIVTPSYQLTPGTTMPIRAYYTNTDFTDVQGSLTAAGYSLTQTGMYFYKVPGNPNNTQTGITIYDPVIYTNQTSGLPAVNSNYLAALAASNQPPAGSSYTNWGWVNYAFGTNSNNAVNQFYAEYQVPSFSSGGGGASPVSPLAVEGLVLSGKSENGVNVLDWATLQETNNSHFEVLRSVDNIAFEAIADVPTKAVNGNSNATLMYEYKDISPIAKTLYYRLKQVDLNGATSLSNIVEINLSEELFATVQVYPNPATNVLNVEWNVPSKKALYIEVVDVVGKTLKKEQYKAKGGAEVYSLDISTLSSGIYTLRVRSVDGSFSSSSQFVKVQN